MMPDFIKVRLHCEGFLTYYFESKIQKLMGVLSSSPKFIVHEGVEHGFQRSDGKDDSEALKHIQVGGSMDKEALNLGDYDEVFSFLDKLAQQKAEAIQNLAFQRIDKSCQENGQSINTEGLSIKETILKMFEKVEIDFNSDTSPKIPQLICSPLLFTKIQNLAQDDKDFINMEIQKILEYKKNGWIERENNRKLVD